MGMPRSIYVKEGEEGVYHCFSRCVRRAFLCGYDSVTGKNFSHRKKWILDRLQYLASIFAIDVCAYAIMENHLHSILRIRPDIMTSWSDLEVATRWLLLCPRKRSTKEKQQPPLAEQIQALAACPERIAILRKRLGNLSWFMGKLNEYISRQANKEDKVKGRFWESRFKCQALLDEVAIVACMVYVDLNQIRAGVASTPEGSNFTSIQERICAWKNQSITPDTRSKDKESAQTIDSEINVDNVSRQIFYTPSAAQTASSPFLYSSESAGLWLSPIQSIPNRRGILDMSTIDYFDLVDQSGRMIHPGKRGFIDTRLEPILNRIGAIPKTWIETVTHFGSVFWIAAGRLTHMREFAGQLNRRWFKGLSTARNAFT